MCTDYLIAAVRRIAMKVVNGVPIAANKPLESSIQ